MNPQAQADTWQKLQAFVTAGKLQIKHRTGQDSNLKYCPDLNTAAQAQDMQSRACIRPLAAWQPQDICFCMSEQQTQCLCDCRQTAKQAQDRTGQQIEILTSSLKCSTSSYTACWPLSFFVTGMFWRMPLTPIRRIELVQAGLALRVATFEVTALYQLIDVEWGPNSLRWF